MIEERLSNISSNIHTMHSEWGTIPGGIGNISTFSTEILTLFAFTKISKEEFNNARFLLAFWYTFYYVKIIETYGSKDSEEIKVMFNKISKKVVDDIYQYPFDIKISNPKSKYLDQMDVYYKYYDIRLSDPDDIIHEMSDSITNLLIKRTEDFRIKFLDVLNFFEQIFPEFKEKTIFHKVK